MALHVSCSNAPATTLCKQEFNLCKQNLNISHQMQLTPSYPTKLQKQLQHTPFSTFTNLFSFGPSLETQNNTTHHVNTLTTYILITGYLNIKHAS